MTNKKKDSGKSSGWWPPSHQGGGYSYSSYYDDDEDWWERSRRSWGNKWDEIDRESNSNILGAIKRRRRWWWYSDPGEVSRKEPPLPEGELGTAIAVLRGVFEQFAFDRIVACISHGESSPDADPVRRMAFDMIRKDPDINSINDPIRRASVQERHNLSCRWNEESGIIARTVMAIAACDRMDLTHPVSHDKIEEWIQEARKSGKLDILEDAARGDLHSLVVWISRTVNPNDLIKYGDSNLQAEKIAKVLQEARKDTFDMILGGSKPTVSGIRQVLAKCLFAQALLHNNVPGSRDGSSKQMGTFAGGHAGLEDAIAGVQEGGEEKNKSPEGGREYKNHVAKFQNLDRRLDPDATRKLAEATGFTAKDIKAINEAVRMLEKATQMTWKLRPNREGIRLDVRTLARTVAGTNEKPFQKPKKVLPDAVELVTMFDISGSVSQYVPNMMNTMLLILGSASNNRFVHFHPGMYRSSGFLVVPKALAEMEEAFRKGDIRSATKLQALGHQIEEVFRHTGCECPESDAMEAQVRDRTILRPRSRTIFLGVGDGALDGERLAKSCWSKFDVAAYLNISSGTINHIHQGGGTDPYHPNGGFRESFYQCRLAGESIPSSVARALRNCVEFALEGRVTSPKIGPPTHLKPGDWTMDQT